MAHIVLLGDSIFDNIAYTGDALDVISHLKNSIPQDWQATLKAVDGSVAENVSGQLLNIPNDSTHLFVSVGGNNAIMNSDVLGLQVDSSAEAFNILSDRVSDFEFHYREMLKNVVSRNLPTTVCTIYYPNFPEPLMQKISVAALSSFNDVIIRNAVLSNIPILDLRLICSEESDYANEIEPSGKGGQKIAAKILEVTENHDFSNKKTVIYY